MSGNTKQTKASMIKSVILHAAILAMLLFSFDFSSKPQQLAVAAQNEPDIIEATFIDSNVIEQQRREKRQAEAQARAEQERRKKQQEKEKRERAEREKRKQQKALEEQEKKQKEEAARQEQQRLQRQKEIEAEQRAEEERRLEEARRVEAERQKKLAEERAAKAAAKQQFVLSETDKYIGLITQVIQRNLIFDKTAETKECRLNIRMASSGLVFDVKILQGDPALCRAAQAAVLRPDSLPVSKDPDVYEKLRDFNLTVEL
ncbi:cell envelope integrity protein TolA [Glaciecola sp. KUL10]|uniref:cell envelope integrity protein TolA n=1 Tax=Glaciecola sp. (strain KUL10) TaxID=2161813 RepID=UPI000D78C0B5|nr:cell envelope integrity protein TolA [Glaciecola sp. KUL10]GBL05797.1 colicin import membrane protein [Glaciecola sp. KUL10]